MYGLSKTPPFSHIRISVTVVSFSLIEGQWSDDDIKDPLSQMINLLAEKRDRALTQRWGLWLTKLDPDNGLKVGTFNNDSFTLKNDSM